MRSAVCSCIVKGKAYIERINIIEYHYNFLIGKKDDEGRLAFDASAKNPVFCWVLFWNAMA
jgi:hypothetical protein